MVMNATYIILLHLLLQKQRIKQVVLKDFSTTWFEDQIRTTLTAISIVHFYKVLIFTLDSFETPNLSDIPLQQRRVLRSDIVKRAIIPLVPWLQIANRVASYYASLLLYSMTDLKVLCESHPLQIFVYEEQE